MSEDLKNIITNKAFDLEPNLKKQVAKLGQKIFNTTYYPDAKKLIKMGEIVNEELNLFLLECVKEYNNAHCQYFLTEHHDVCSLRGVWTAMSFSNNPQILSYLQDEIDASIAHRSFAHRYLFEIFRLHSGGHQLLPSLCGYYDRLIHTLPIYELLRQINLTPLDIYDFNINFITVNSGFWFKDADVGEPKHNFRLELNLHSPFIYDNTFKISIRNSDTPIMRIDFNDDGVNFHQKADISSLCLEPNILNLKPFLDDLQKSLGVKFNACDIKNSDKSYLGLSKGLNKAKILNWLTQIFE